MLLLLVFAWLSSPLIELEQRSLLQNKIEILVPKHFTEMSAKMRDLKYPGVNRPQLILTDEGGAANIAFNLTQSRANAGLLHTYQQVFKSTFNAKFPTANWIAEEVTTINGKKVGILQVITEAIDQKIYNYLFFTDVDGKLLIGTFNCLEKDRVEWQPVADRIVNSLVVK